MENEIRIYNSQGGELTDLSRLKSELLAKHWEEKSGLLHNFDFHDAFIDTLDQGRIKINQVQVTYDIVAAKETAFLEGYDLGLAIMKDTLSGYVTVIGTGRDAD